MKNLNTLIQITKKQLKNNLWNQIKVKNNNKYRYLTNKIIFSFSNVQAIEYQVKNLNNITNEIHPIQIFINEDRISIFQEIESKLKIQNNAEWDHIRKLYLRKLEQNGILQESNFNSTRFMNSIQYLANRGLFDSYTFFMLLYLLKDQKELNNSLVNKISNLCFLYIDNEQSSQEILLYIFYFFQNYMFANRYYEKRRKEYIYIYERNIYNSLKQFKLNSKKITNLKIKFIYLFVKNGLFFSFIDKCEMFEEILKSEPIDFDLQYIKYIAYIYHYLKSEIININVKNQNKQELSEENEKEIISRGKSYNKIMI